MNSQKEKRIFDTKNHTGVMQDKYPPGRITAGMSEPATATLVADGESLSNRILCRGKKLQIKFFKHLYAKHKFYCAPFIQPASYQLREYFSSP